MTPDPVAAPPERRFELHYEPTPALVRATQRHWLWRYLGGWLVGYAFIAVAAAALARSEPWLSGFFAGALAVTIANFLRARHRLVMDARRLEGIGITLEVEASGMTFHTPKGSSQMPWRSLTRAERTGAFWVLWQDARSAPVYLPATLFDAEAESFLRGQLAAASVRVTG